MPQPPFPEDRAFVVRGAEVEMRPAAPPRRRPRLWLHWLLFVLTTLSVFVAGLVPGAGGWLGLSILYGAAKIYVLTGQLIAGLDELFLDGAIFSGCLMATLVAHEFGHFLTAKAHRVPATPPFFIPFPILNPFGTLGAVILQAAQGVDRRKLFDIAVAGPLAGLVIAIPVVAYGISISEVVAFEGPVGLRYGDPLLVRGLVTLFHGPYDPSKADVLLNAPLFAGWVGIFITALNLVPLGQLDGGHILYALVGRRQHAIAAGVIGLGVVAMILTKQYTYVLMLCLIVFMGFRHPPTANDRIPLGMTRRVLGWTTLAFVLVGFTPQPIMTDFGPEPPLAPEPGRPGEPLEDDVDELFVQPERRPHDELHAREFLAELPAELLEVVRDVRAHREEVGEHEHLAGPLLDAGGRPGGDVGFG